MQLVFSLMPESIWQTLKMSSHKIAKKILFQYKLFAIPFKMGLSLSSGKPDEDIYIVLSSGNILWTVMNMIINVIL